MVGLLDTALKADIPAIVPDLLLKLRNLSALAQDVLLLADAILPLAEVLRYGDARQTNSGAIEQLLDQMVPRVCIQLPAACLAINEEAAMEVLKKIMAVNRALGILQVPDYELLWAKTLVEIYTSEQSSALLSGLCCRLATDKKLLPVAASGDAMRYHLSKAQAPATAAQWLDGFLHGSGLLLLHYPDLWQILNDWVRQLPDDFFREILPVLRRTFSRFTPPERSKMLDLSKNKSTEADQSSAKDREWNAERARGVHEILSVILQ